MTKIVINACHGGYGLSMAACKELGIPAKEGCDNCGYSMAFENDRSNPALVACVEKLGKEASGRFAELKVVEIPDDVDWEICEYDGAEWVAEKHRTWG